MSQKCIDTVSAGPRDLPGWEQLYFQTAPQLVAHVQRCKHCQDLLAEIELHHMLDFMCWDYSDPAYRKLVRDRLCSSNTKKILQVEIATLVWLRAGYLSLNDPTPPDNRSQVNTTKTEH